MSRLILASSSPRRQEVLRKAGFEFEAVASGVDESARAGEDPVRHVERLALEKATEVAGRFPPGNEVVVLGADTVVVARDVLLGKPATPEEAAAMLQELSGVVHEVVTGVALIAPGAPRRAVAHERTRVFFRTLSAQEIADYVASGEPLDKAGAYAIQGLAGRFVTRIEGCYFNVMGLPLALVDRLLREWGRG